MEYFELDDLEKFITPKLTEKDVKVIGRQLLEGLQVLHGYHLAHRDLKPANIFAARCAPDWWIKLGNFVIVKRIFTEHNSRLSLNGSLDYMAPEILLENDDDDEQHSPHTLAIDVWSLGCSYATTTISPAKASATILSIEKALPYRCSYQK